MEENIEYKQQFLRSEIIDQGYNPDDFSEYMANVRGDDNLNLETWSFSDLQTVVEQYKLKISKLSEQEQNTESQNNNNNTEENIQQNENKEKEVKEESLISKEKENKEKKSNEIKFPKEPFEEYEHIIKTVKLNDNEITNNNNLFITIKNPVKINPGFFSSSYYQYTVQTNPVGYKAVRKLSDFIFLNEILPLFNSSVFNPVLPNFEFGLKDDSPKKMLYIQNYMNSLIENKFFRTLPIIFEFLTLSQEEWNKKRVEKYNKMKPLRLSQIPTLEGEFHILINKLNDNKGSKIKEEINKKSETFDELNIAIDEILSLIDKISLSFKSLGKAFLDLSKIYKVNNNNENNNDNILYNIFNRLSSLSKIWSRNYLKEKDFLNSEFKLFFNYMNNENISFIKKYEEYKTIKDDYINKFEKMKKIQNKNEKDLKIFNHLRIDYGLELLMVNNEYEKLIERQGNRMMGQFLKYNDNKKIILQDFKNCVKLFNLNEDPNNINLDIEGLDGILLSQESSGSS